MNAAVLNSQLEQPVRSQTQLAFLLDLSELLRQGETPEAILQIASDQLGAWLSADRVFYAEIAGSLMSVTKEFRQGVRSLVGEHSLEAFGPNLLSAYRTQTIISIDNVAADERLGEEARAGLKSRQVGSFVDVVLFTQETFVGLLAVQTLAPRIWTDDEKNLIREVAERVKIAIERSRVQEALVKSAARHRFRVELGDALQSLDSSACIMTEVARRLGPFLEVDQANYYHIEGDQFIVSDEYRTDAVPGMLGRHSLTGFAKDTLDILRSGRMLRLSDTSQRDDAAAFSELNMVSVLSIPLLRDGRWVGGLHVHNALPRAWSDEEEALLREVAVHAWAAMERARAEEELRALNDTLEMQVAERAAERDRLWSLSQDMFARADYSGMMSAVSPGWTELLGWSETELLTRGYAAFMHPEDMPPTLVAIAQMAETQRPTRFTNRIATKAGGFKLIEWTAAPEPDGRNFVAVGRDMSLVQAKEEALLLAQEQLRQSQKLEAMGQLTGGVAHDFNNLLTPIIGSLDMLTRRGVGNERERRMIDGALQSAERAKILVQRLLAFARRQPLQAKAVDVRALVDSMSGLIGSTLGPTILVDTRVEPKLPTARADENQLEMALLNLAVNARDAMPNGGTLTIVAKREETKGDARIGLAQGSYICLSVEDTGEGMDAATLTRAIEPFFSTKGIGKGTGLGLSMVHGLAAQLGGALDIRSGVGHGTSVRLWLPLSGEASDIAASEKSRSTAEHQRGKALLVDDEPLVRMSTSDMLGDLGFDVIEASNAQEALRLLDEGLVPNILVTDHLMPGMNGAELARAFNARQPDSPVVIVSGYAEIDGVPSDIPRLVKPFRNAELAETLAKLIP